MPSPSALRQPRPPGVPGVKSAFCALTYFPSSDPKCCISPGAGCSGRSWQIRGITALLPLLQGIFCVAQWAQRRHGGSAAVRSRDTGSGNSAALIIQGPISCISRLSEMGSYPPTSVNCTQGTLCSPDASHQALAVLSAFSPSALPSCCICFSTSTLGEKKNVSWVFAALKTLAGF